MQKNPIDTGLYPSPVEGNLVGTELGTVGTAPSNSITAGFRLFLCASALEGTAEGMQGTQARHGALFSEVEKAGGGGPKTHLTASGSLTER